MLQGESVPTADKIVNLFEPHAYIVRKGGRDTFYGQKAALATGAADWCSMPRRGASLFRHASLSLVAMRDSPASPERAG